jgi:putative ABC transport system ATP-binding protein
MGPSGNGKTTLLNCLSGLDDIDAGTVEVEGKSIHELSDRKRTKHRAQSMGFVFQAFNLIPVLSAVENAELPLLVNGHTARQAREAATAMLDRVGLGERLDHKPNELSGGEQQRVTIARALVAEPAIIWADEPTGNLDSETADSVLELMAEVNSSGQTIVMVTHEPDLMDMADRLVLIRNGEVEYDGVPSQAPRRLEAV